MIPRIHIDQLKFAGRVIAASVVFINDPGKEPVFVHVDLDGSVSSSEAFDATKVINLQCAATGPVLPDHTFDDIFQMVTSSPEIYVHPMMVEAEEQAERRGIAIQWT